MIRNCGGDRKWIPPFSLGRVGANMNKEEKY